MDPEPTRADRDARLLGLALLHGYVEADQLRAAAAEDPGPSRILAVLRAAGVLDEPCLEGLERALRDLDAGGASGHSTGPTHMEPPRHVTPATGGRGAEPSGGWDLDPLGSAARLLRQFSVPAWKQYRDLRFVGEGGMGRIYKARDPDLRRTVALKFLRRQEPAQLKRFLFEAQAQALLDHPNVCRVYEISEWQGQHYIAMQYVNGPTLTRAAPGLALDEKLRIGEAVAEAVHAAHFRGLIHRDLKPANVLLEKGEDGGWKPYVLDFGLARELEAPGLTLSGLVLGTAAYMSPEQARGEAHHVDRRTDVYGLGATLYELFGGAPPFGEASGIECLRLVLEEEPALLRTRDPGLPRDLETVIARCLEKEPDRRYDDARSLALDLRRVREGEPIQARRASLMFRARRYARRNRAVVAVAAAALAGVLAFSGIAAYTRHNAAQREQYAQRFSQQAEGIVYLVRFAKVHPTHDIEPQLRDANLRLANLESDARRLGRLASAPGAFAMGRALLGIGETERAVAHLERAAALGYVSEELRYALGQCYAARYRRELDSADRLPTPSDRRALTAAIPTHWRDLALAQFQRASGQKLDPSWMLDVLIDATAGRTEAAIEKIRRMKKGDPLYFEAAGLEGELNLLLGRNATEYGQAAAYLQAASSCFTEARTVAPSDPGLWLGEARVRRELVRRANGSGEAAENVRLCRAAIDQYQLLRAHDDLPLVEVAWSLAYLAELVPPTRRREVQGTVEEGLALAERVLRAAPSSGEAIGAKVALLVRQGRSMQSAGADPASVFVAAVEAARDGLSRMPDDAALLSWGLLGAQSLLIHQGSVGKDMDATWNLAVRWAEAYRRKYPDQMYAHIRTASLFVERAEWEKSHGRDPDHSVATALAAIGEAIRLGAEQPNLRSAAGDAHLIRGQYALSTGRDGAGDLDRAAEFYRVRLASPVAGSSAYGALAEARIYRGIQAFKDGGDPSSWILQAKDSLDRGLKVEEYFWLYQLRGQCEWIEARWAVRRGLPAQLPFQRAEQFLRKACSMGRTAEANRWLAQLLLDRARCQQDPAATLHAGVAVAEEAVRLDPRSSDSLFLLARLLEAQATNAGGAPADRQRARAAELQRKARELNPGVQSLLPDPAPPAG